MKAFVQQNLPYLRLDILLRDGDYIGQKTDIVFKEIEDRGVLLEPTLSLPLNAGEALMDALWQAGLRPSGRVSDTGETDALKKHIEFAEGVVWTIMGVAGE